MPNGEDKKNNFVLKVWDDVKQEFRPSYIAPDATDTVQGDVKLSDATDSTLDAANGMTAATPKAVKTVQDNANNKLDKVNGVDQTVASKVTFNESLTLQKGATIPTGQYLTGNVNGNATTATTLQTARTIAVKNGNATQGSASFSGAADITINVPQIDATTLTGLVPMASIPQGAMERLVKVENETARFALSTDDVQLGDSVLQLDTEVMYVVVDIEELDNAAGYQEYKAGTAVLADTAERVENALTVQKNGITQFVYDGSAAQTINIASSFADLSGQIAADQIPDGIITDTKLGVNYAGSDTKGGAATSANRLSTARTISLTGIITGSVEFDGSQDVSLTSTLGEGVIQTNHLADNAVTTDKLGNSSVTSAKIVDGTITGTDIANSTITGGKIAADTITAGNIAAGAVGTSEIAANAVTSAKIAAGNVGTTQLADSSVTSAKIANGTIALGDLSSAIGTVVVSSTQPSDSHVLLWVKP